MLMLLLLMVDDGIENNLCPIRLWAIFFDTDRRQINLMRLNLYGRHVMMRQLLEIHALLHCNITQTYTRLRCTQEVYAVRTLINNSSSSNDNRMMIWNRRANFTIRSN